VKNHILTLAFAALLTASAAQAGTITYSHDISDDDAPLTDFQAVVNYDFDEGTNTLSLEIFNNTNPTYTLSQLYFNTSDAVTGLQLVQNPAFSNASLYALSETPAANRSNGNKKGGKGKGNGNNNGGNGGNGNGGNGNGGNGKGQLNGGFGFFDFRLDFDKGNDGLQNGSTTFNLTAQGSGLTINDFFSHGSSKGGNSLPYTTSIKFTQGPGDDSVFGAGMPGDVVVPEPASVTLAGLGISALALRRRFLRKRS
jgi:hypothetical protein